MKKMMLTIALFVMSSTSQAVVADRFKCTLEVKDLMSKASTTEEKDFFIARLPRSLSPSPDVRQTVGQTLETLTLETPQAQLTATLNFYYNHAVKTDAHGIVEARQMTCVGLTGDYCERSRGGGIQACSIGLVACSESPPFDPIHGWATTGLVGGVPTFNEQTLGPATADITDDHGVKVGLVNLNCQHMGSFQ